MYEVEFCTELCRNNAELYVPEKVASELCSSDWRATVQRVVSGAVVLFKQFLTELSPEAVPTLPKTGRDGIETVIELCSNGRNLSKTDELTVPLGAGLS